MYFTFLELNSKRSRAQIESLAEQFVQTRTLKGLAIWLNMDPHKLQLLAAHPKYETFFVPKRNGGKRLIQHPTKQLKKLQKRLAYAFQAVYYPMRTDSAYGFLLCPADDERPRNIYTNASQHIGQHWVINVDLKDFFHQIKIKQLRHLFQTEAFGFTAKAAQVLARLCCCDGRLPMGAPTSPILSNFACINLDQALESLAESRGYVYTRYADDLTISSHEKIDAKQLGEIRKCVEQFGFRLNEKKLILQDGAKKPEVTGLILKKNKADVSESFIDGIKYDMKVLKAFLAPRMIEREIFPEKPVLKLRQSIQGQINFVKFVRGKDHKSCLKLQAKLDACLS